jgi:hypothetical protein
MKSPFFTTVRRHLSRFGSAPGPDLREKIAERGMENYRYPNGKEAYGEDRSLPRKL